MNQFETLPLQSRFSAFESINGALIQNMMYGNNLHREEQNMSKTNFNNNSFCINQNYSSSSNNYNNWSDVCVGTGVAQKQRFASLNDLASYLAAPGMNFSQTELMKESNNGLDDVNQLLIEKYWLCDLRSQSNQILDISQLTSEHPEKLEYPKSYEEKEELYLKLLIGYKYEIVSYYDNDKEKEITFYKCKYEDCDKQLLKPWNLLDHVRMHEGVKPYLCQWWGKRFTQKGNLKKHARQHVNPDVNDRKRYSCRFCGKGYTERYNLKVNFWFIFIIWFLIIIMKDYAKVLILIIIITWI